MFKITFKLEQKQRFDEDVKRHADQIASKITEMSETCRKALETYYLTNGSFPHYKTLDECSFKTGKLSYKNGRDPFAPSGTIGHPEFSDSLNNTVRKTVQQNHPHVDVNGFKEKETFWSKGNYFNYNITIKKEHYTHLNKN